MGKTTIVTQRNKPKQESDPDSISDLTKQKRPQGDTKRKENTIRRRTNVELTPIPDLIEMTETSWVLQNRTTKSEATSIFAGAEIRRTSTQVLRCRKLDRSEPNAVTVMVSTYLFIPSLNPKQNRNETARSQTNRKTSLHFIS